MLAFLLQRNGAGQKLVLRYACRREKIRDCRLAGGDGSGFVERDDLNSAGFLQTCCRLEENAVLRAETAADHDRNRRRQTQRAWTADDQHRDAAREAVAEGLADQQPDNRCDNCNRNDRRDKNAGDLVGNFGNRRFGRRCVGDHLNDLRERRVLPDARGAAGQKARLVDRCGRDRIAGGFVRRDALAGERRLVDRARAIEHHAVDRNALAGADDEGVSGLYLLDGDGLFLAASYNRRRFGRELHEAFERVRRLALRACLQHLADGDER